MKEMLSLVSKIHEKGNRFIIEELKNNGAEGLVPSHGDILVCLYKNGKMTMKEIANSIHRTKPTVTVLVDKLEKLGYLKRENYENGKAFLHDFLELTSCEISVSAMPAGVKLPFNHKHKQNEEV